jgi:uncharacterized protein (TIGR03435 family)
MGRRTNKVFAYVLIGLGLFAPGVRGQQLAATPPTALSHPLKFDVASLKLARPDESMRIMPTANGFVAHSVSAIQLILFAYRSADASQSSEGIVLPEQIAGLPSWAKTTRFDIDAKVLSDQAAQLQNGTTEQRRAVHQKMLAALLADRFHLIIHY